MNWEESVTKLESSQLNETLKLMDTAQESQEIKQGRTAFLYTYTGIIVVGVFTYTLRSISFYRMCLRISINLHDMMLRGVTRAKMIFFKNNPSGRILNRFARDINNADSLLPNSMYGVIDVSFTCFKWNFN